MVEKQLKEVMHKDTSEYVQQLIGSIDNVYIEYKLDDLMQERGLKQKDLSRISGLRNGTISDILNGKKVQLNQYHLVTLMIALRITDVRQLVNFAFTDETEKQFEEEREYWIKYNKIPRSLLDIDGHHRDEGNEE